MGKTIHRNCQFSELYDVFPKNEFPAMSLKKCFMTVLIVTEKHPKVKTLMRSFAMLFKEQRRHVSSKQFFVIHPYSWFRILWEMLIVVCQLCTLIYEPYIIAFYDQFTWATYDTWHLAFQSLCFTDTMLNFVTGYINKQTVVMDIQSIIFHYLLRGFLINFLATFPWEVPLLIYKEQIKTAHLQYLRIVSVFTLYRLRCLYCYAMTTGPILRLPHVAVRLCTDMVGTIVWCTWAVMAQIFIPCFVVQDDSYRSPKIGYGSISNQLFNCVYEGGTAFTKLACGSIVALTGDEMLTDVITLLMGEIWQIYMLIILVHRLFRWDTSSARYDVMMKQLEAYMTSKRLPPDLERRILLYYEHRTQKMFFKEQKLLENLSVRLRTELMMHRSERLMRSISLFNKLPRTVIAKLAPFLRRDLYLPNDVIIKAGALDDEMYFLATGCVAIYTRWGEEIRHLEDGAYFGEIAMLLKDERRTTSVAAVSVCEVYTLHRDDFLRVLRPFRELYRGIESTARQRLENLLQIEAQRRRARRRATPSGDDADDED